MCKPEKTPVYDQTLMHMFMQCIFQARVKILKWSKCTQMKFPSLPQICTSTKLPNNNHDNKFYKSENALCSCLIPCLYLLPGVLPSQSCIDECGVERFRRSVWCTCGALYLVTLILCCSLLVEKIEVVWELILRIKGNACLWTDEENSWNGPYMFRGFKIKADERKGESDG